MVDLGYEPEYTHCMICGFMVKTDRDALGIGTGTVVGTATTTATITEGDTSIAVSDTSTFESSGLAYIYSADGKSRDMFSYTGKASTSFTGIPSSGIKAVDGHSGTGLVVCDCNPKVQRGCPLCGSLNYLAGSKKVRV